MRRKLPKFFIHYFILFAWLFLLTPIVTKASHVQGGDITYRCLGGNQYEVTLSLYRDCAGASAPTTVSINRKSVTCNINSNFTLNRVTGTGIEVSPVCPNLATVCTNGTQPGVQEYKYSGIITLPPCADWKLSYSLSARNAAITTISNPGGQSMYLEATLDNLHFPCNNSPTFTNRPVPFICVGQPYCFNNGSNDVDGDSLSYTLITPRTSATTTVNYTGGYSATQPLASTPAATFNAATGDMCVTPTMIQVTVLAMQVSEWRNGVLVGTVMRDIQIRTITCSNNNPSINGINNTGSYTMNACSGIPISFNIPSFDVDGSQNVSLTWNSGITGAIFNAGTGNRPTGVFTWTPTTNDVSNVSHCFTVTVKDNACPFIGSQTYSFCITVGGFGTSTSSINSKCTSANGSAQVTVVGGAEPISYSWLPAGTAGNVATASNLAAGTYTCTVSDIAGCSQPLPITVNNTPGGTATIGAFANISCHGANNGSITVSMTGAATPPFTYVWSPSSAGTGVSASNLGPGTYSVTVTDANGCTSTASQVITDPATLTVNKTFTNVGCYGGSTGTATATASGGTGPYTYLWMPGALSTSSIGSLPVGNYTVTVTDSRGCTASTTANIVQPPALSISASTTTANCGQNNGSATVTGTGGFAPYTWHWSNGQAAATATGLAAGTYTVSITDLNLCRDSIAVTVGSIAGPAAQITSSTAVSCNGGSNGNATVGITGGSQPMTYLWNNGQTTPTAGNLSAGIYSVQITDGLGCIASASVTITQPALLSVNVAGTNPVCFGNTNGNATASAVGGTTPYNYVWSVNGNPTTPTLNNLGAGTYNITVTDAKGCIKTSSVVITNPPVLNTSISKTNASCNGHCDGTATATVTNGTAPYVCLWNNPSAQTAATATDLCAGSYTVTVTDAHGCPSQGVVTITEPTPLVSTVTSYGNLNCYQECIGYAQTTTTGGTGPYTYSWSLGAGATATISNLCAGTYTCTVTDSKGCTDTAATTITQPQQLVASIVSTNINCYGTCDGTGTIVFSGGTAPYTALWTPGMQTIFNPINLCTGLNIGKVTDAKGCSVTDSVTLTESYTPVIVSISTTNSNCGQSNGGACASVSGGLAPYSYIWSDSSVTQASCVTGIPAGSYSVDVTDANGCFTTTVANINDISSPSVSISSHTNLLCNGYSNATAIATISGGVSPYTELWIPGNQTTTSPNNLAGGVNTIKVTDAAGCIASTSVTITEPPVINHAISTIINISCYGLCDGSATVVAAGGTGTLTFQWDDPALQTTPTAGGLCIGNKIVTIKDQNNCTAQDTATIITQPNSLAIASSIKTNVTCNGDGNGTITPVITGGTPYYLFSWAPTGNTSPIENALNPGTYTLTVTDQNGCNISQNWTITEPPLLTDTVTTIPSNCGQANGSALVTANGGTSPYSYQWSDSGLQTTATASGLYGSIYNITVTDANGCVLTKSAVVNDLSGPVISSITTTPVLCFGGNTGTATAHLTPGLGIAPYTFSWTPSAQNDSTANSLTQGTYSVTVTDSKSCVTNGVAIINEPNMLQLFVSVNDTLCFGDTAQVYATASGGTPAYSYTWIGTSGNSFVGSGPFTVIPQTSTMYSALATDNNGCTTSQTNMYTFVKPPLIIHAIDTSMCEGDSIALQVIIDSGSMGPFEYQWFNGSTNQNVTVAPTGTSPSNYTVSVSDGCSSPVTDTSTITINPAPVGTITGVPQSGCQPLTAAFDANGNNMDSYNWDFGDGNSSSENPTTNTFNNAGMYNVTLTITSAAGCSKVIDSTSYVTVYPLPTAGFSTDFSLSPIITFNDLSASNITNRTWNFGDPTTTADSSNQQNPIYEYPNAGNVTVTLIVMNQHGCKDTTTQQIEIIEQFEFYAPNSFSPNADNTNEVFIPKAVGFIESTFVMMIFDRWGNLIYFTDDFHKGWDGRANHGSNIAQRDVYVWKVELTDNSNQKHKYLGTVTLLN